MINKKKTYYFIGIGGIGMSALARYFHHTGNKVSGYDRTPTELTNELIAEGIEVFFEENISHITPDTDMVIYTPAIPHDSIELNYAKEKQIPLKKRSEVLGELASLKKCIAVAGSHGKTTVSSLIAHLLNTSKIGCSAFLGGISKNLNSNVLINSQSDYLVVEADEYDKSFLALYPYYTVITSADADHLDIYETHDNLYRNFNLFANQTQPEGKLFAKLGLGFDINPDIQKVTYSLDGLSADYYVWNLRVYKGRYFFDLHIEDNVLYDIEFNYPGLHNIENAVVASVVALECGVSEEELREGLKTFQGVKRRFDYRIQRDDLVFIDDYAHHPNELKAIIESVRHLYPNKKITGIFQPHLYSRTRDFGDEFARVLETLDEVVLLDIYPAREESIPGITSKWLLMKINKMDKYLTVKEDLTGLLEALYPEIILTLGAGDIDKLVAPIEDAFKNTTQIE